MITFYKHSDNCIKCYETQEVLKELVVAHTIKDLDKSAYKIATLIEGKKKVEGHASIKTYLDDLAEQVHQWNQFQGDSCYVDKGKKTC